MFNDSKNIFKVILYNHRVLVANVFILMGLITAFLDPFARIHSYNLIIGFIIAFSGILLRIWASSYVWSNIDSVSPQANTGLITGGPYAYVRNPIYLGAILLVSGLNIGLASPLAVVTMLIPTIATHYWQAKFEESYLSSTFSESYLRYKQHVPLLIPRPWRVYEDKQGNSNLLQGIKSDIGPLSGFLIFCVIIAIYLNHAALGPLWLALILGVSVFLSLIVVFCVKKLGA